MPCMAPYAWYEDGWVEKLGDMVVGVPKLMVGCGAIELAAQAHCCGEVTWGCECGGNFAKSVGATAGVMKDSGDVQVVKGSSSSDQE